MVNKVEYNRLWREANKEKFLEYTRKYRNKNRELINKRAAESRKQNKEKYSESSRKWYNKNKERVSKNSKKWRLKTKETHWVDRILSAAKARCSQRNLEFNLIKSDIVVPDICPILNVPISIKNPKDYRPSLDRIDNTKGYIKGNVRIISMRANRIKSDASLKELEAIVDYIKING